MGYIKEPDGVDFIIESKPLSEKERAEISEFIKKYKAENTLSKAAKGKKTSAKAKVPN